MGRSGDALVTWAKHEAERRLWLLSNRWQHVQGVVALAETLRPLFSKDDASMLIAAAYLHDIGYAPELVETGFHPIDGARYLRAIGEERLASLVAYHSESQHEAKFRGLQGDLAEFPHEVSPLADALTYCDMLTGPTGQHVTLEERNREIVRRYGPHHIVTRAHRLALPEYRTAIKRIRERQVRR